VNDRPTAAPPGFNLIDAEEALEAPARTRRLGRRLLGRPWIVHRGDGRRPEIALTFDDGPSRWTPQIAAAFEEHGCHATFFLRGAAVVEHPRTVAALATAGHELGNHLWSHADPATQEPDEIRAEIERTGAAIQAAGGPRPRLVRPPYAKAPEKIALAAKRMGVRAIVLRSVGSSDWAASSAEEVLEPILASVEPGAIVCMHDGISPDDRDSDSREPTAAAVRQMVPALLERGLEPVTVSRLLS
jgi:peptidoglycan/xylan/chitin deacetylase (PgdA/CDA1 family)